MNIWEKLLCMQMELKAPKNLHNDYGGFNYRNAEAILEAAKPLADKYKTCLIVYDTIDDHALGTYITAHARLIDIEKPDDIVEVTASAREAEQKKGMDFMQISGCASSYARKYALNGLFCIDDTKDSDALPPEESPRQQTRTQQTGTQAHICERCGKLIADRSHNGVRYTATKIVQNAMKKHGVPLCWDCFNEANREVSSDAKTANPAR